MDDLILILQMKQGNEDAFDKFVRKYYAQILQYCRYHCRNLETAEDLTQETFLKFFAHLHAYHHRGKTKNYLYTIARNLCINQTKQKLPLPVAQERVYEQKDSANGMERIENRIVMEQAMTHISAEFREIIILFYFQQCKLTEIADILQISLPLVKYRLRRAKEELKQVLGEEG